jgi:signal transduction histidine kinase
MHSYAGIAGAAAGLARSMGIRSSVGAPIVVDGRLWGAMIASSRSDRPLPADTESRIAAFTDLVATAISNADARAQIGRLAEEQATLRRVATLVARDVPANELFAAVTEEVGRLLGAGLAAMLRYERDDTTITVAAWAAVGQHGDVGRRWALDGGDVAATIARTGRPAQIDGYDGVPGPLAAYLRDELGVGSSAGSPIVVEGLLWGTLIVHSIKTGALPADADARLVNFTELVATAIANAQARADVHRLADEQAALRRVATLVAHESPAAEVFAAVVEELGQLLAVDEMRMLRYEEDRTVRVLAGWGELDSAMSVGSRHPLGGENVSSLVLRTGRPARIDDYSTATGVLGAYARRVGIRSMVATPIVVEGRVWGAMMAASLQVEPLPSDTESRIGQFAELTTTAISNIQARSDVVASRARVVQAADEERRRVVQDLHDGAQQRLVQTVITLKLARRALANGEEAAPELLDDALAHAEQATVELRELAHGILPSVLTHGGLSAGVDALASRMPVPVENGVSVGRLPAVIEATAYFVVAEAFTNVAKHAHAGSVAVAAHLADATLHVQVRDDGVGGARAGGSGLLGLRDRLAAVNGRLRVESPPEGGTVVAAAIPLAGKPDESQDAGREGDVGRGR